MTRCPRLSVAAVALLAALAAGCGKSGTADDAAGVAAGPGVRVTFNRDVAPILFEQCVACHRPGQPAPFILLTYGDARKRAEQIADVTGRRLMPPWLPEAGHGDFEGVRRLSDAQIAVLKQWADEGAPEGAGQRAPAPPVASDGWLMGKPDLVLSMAEEYALAADGPDVYRHFVLPVPGQGRRWVRAVEFDPGNARVIHHAVVLVDRTGSVRALDAQDPEAGFGGFMVAGNARIPDGQFVGWAPGRSPSPGRPGMAWSLSGGDDLVLQVHLKRTGRGETARSRIGLHFAGEPPRLHPYSLVLRNKLIDIPAGSTNVTVVATNVLPVDVELLAVYPHAHYLGKEIKAGATLPDGRIEPLLWIRDWNPDWQDEYRYARPVRLPRGTVITMSWRFDNSAGNVRNPHRPPGRVRYGRNATDEMAELLLQVLPADEEGFRTLRAEGMRGALAEDLAMKELRLRDRPRDAGLLREIAARHLELGQAGAAVERFAEATRIEPGFPAGWFALGDARARTGDFVGAAADLEEACRLEPRRPEPWNALAQVILASETPGRPRLDRAVEAARRAAELTDRQQPLVLLTLARALAAADVRDEAIAVAIQARALAVAQGQGEIASRIDELLSGLRTP